MKITKSQLKQIIREEVEETLEEAPSWLAKLFGDKDSTKGMQAPAAAPEEEEDEYDAQADRDRQRKERLAAEKEKCDDLNDRYNGENYFWRGTHCDPCGRGSTHIGKNQDGSPDCRTQSSNSDYKYTPGEGGYGGFRGYSESQVKKIVKETVRELYPYGGDK